MNNESSTFIDSGQGFNNPFDIVDELKAGFDRFLSGHTAHPHATEARRHQLAGGQHPQVALLACSDSRVPVEVIFDAGFGDLFVIRNAGNTNTFGSAGSIEYAVLDLHVRVLVIMSHQSCGAVKAAYLKDEVFSKSLTELVLDIKNGLTSHEINVENPDSYGEACIKHATITAKSLMESSIPVREAVKNKELLIQPAYLQIDPLAIHLLEPFFGQ